MEAGEIVALIIILVVFIWIVYASTKSDESKPYYNQASNFYNNSPKTQSFSGSIGKFQTQIKRNVVKDIEVYGLFLKGIIPVKSKSNDIVLATSIIDVTDNYNNMPVRSIVNQFQETNTTYFSSVTKIGQINPGFGWSEWTFFGYAPTLAILPPYGGIRKLAFHTRILNFNASQNTDLNRFDQSYLDGLTTQIVEVDFPGKYGYLDMQQTVEKEIEKIELLIVRLVMYVAMIDGVLHNNEGTIIKNWIKKRLAIMSFTRAEEMKSKFNSTMKNSHSEYKKGFSKSIYTKYINEFNNVANDTEKYELFDLLLDVLVSDGEAHSKQVELLNLASGIIDLDYQVIENLKDNKFLDLDNISDSGLSMEELLGIDENMSKVQIKNKLNKMFMLWNSRTESLTDKQEIEKANQMLELIAEARQKYQ